MEIKDLSGSLTAFYGYAKSSIDSAVTANTKKAVPETGGSQTAEKTQHITPAIDGTKLSISKGSNFYDILDLSDVSVKLAREITKFKGENQIKGMTDEELFAAAPEITDGLIETFIDAGKTVEKPDESYDDLAWGMLVTIGNQIGLTDPDALMEITVGDLAMYFDEKFHKTQDVFDVLGNLDQNGNPVKVYEKPEDMWKDIFLTDEKGEFIRGNGGTVVRNMDFERTQTSVSYFTDFASSEGKGAEKLLSNIDPGSMLTFALALERGDSFIFKDRLFIKSLGSSSAKSFFHQQLSTITDPVKKMNEYKRTLAIDYLVHKDLSNRFGSPQAQHNEMMGTLLKGEEKWITYKPFQGQGIYDEIPRYRPYNK